MAHGVAFGQFLDEQGPRGRQQAGGVNWTMLMARRRMGRGRFQVRGMFSLEPWTISGCGYPNLLESGELCGDEPIHDLQHPHDLLMETAVQYDWPVTDRLALQVYGGLSGEPALGPVAFPHRLSALPNSLAPISHHWMDAAHITFGVVTTGVYGRTWKVEGSLFNGREPDEQRRDLDMGSLDSWSGRVSWLPITSLSLQISGGHLEEAEAQSLHDGGARFDVERVTASASYHRVWGVNSLWATTVAWGRNTEAVGRTGALLVESNLTVSDRESWFWRYEIGAKPAYDLGVVVPGSCTTNKARSHCSLNPTAAASDLGSASAERPSRCCAPETPTVKSTYTVSKAQIGYVRSLKAWHALKPGVGASASLSMVPADLERYYGNRTTFGLGLFVTIRFAARLAHGAHQ